MSAKLKISEIAKNTGISASTVSRVLSGKANTSAEVRAQVLACAREKGVLSHLGSDRLLFQTLMVFAPSRAFGFRTDVYYYNIVQSIRQAASSHEVYLHFCPLEETNSDLALFMQKMNDKSCDAALILGNDDPRIHDMAANLGKPCVLINCRDIHMRLDAVLPDHRAIGELSAHYLLAAGHRKILCLMCQRRETMLRRLEGVKDAFGRASLSFHKKDVLPTEGFSVEESEALVGKYLLETPEENHPSAILAWGDYMAVGAYNALLKMGISVPNDISIMSMDGQNLADIHEVPLTATQIPRRELGEEALKRLQRRSLSPEMLPSTLLLSGLLVERSSVKRLSPKKTRQATAHHASDQLYGEDAFSQHELLVAKP